MKKTTILSVLILLLVSLCYPLFSQQNNPIQQNTIWEVLHCDINGVDRYPNIPFKVSNNLILDNETGKGFINTDQGLMITYDGGCSWKLLEDEGEPIRSSVIAFQDDYYLVCSEEGIIQLIRNLDSDNRTIIRILENEEYYYDNNEDRFDYSITEAPKGVFYKGKFYFYIHNRCHQLLCLSKDGILLKVLPYSDEMGIFNVDSRLISIFIRKDILFIVTDKGAVYYMDSEMAEDFIVTYMNIIDISPNSFSHYSPNDNVVCIATTDTENLYQEIQTTISRNIDNYELTNGNNMLYVKYLNFNYYFHLKDIHFINKDIGYVLGINGNTSCIYSTNNGGFDWQLEYTTNNFISKFISINNQICAISDEESDQELLMRNNSTSSWASVDYIPARSDADTLRSVWCVSGNHCLAVGSDSNIVYRTRNSTDWIKEKLDIDPVRKHPFYQIYFKDEMIGSISSGLDVVFNTTDGGNTWTKEYTNAPEIIDGNAISIAPNGNIKLVVCNEGSSIYKTPMDNFWIPLNTYDYSTYGINDVAFKDDNYAYAVGNSGGLYKYSCFGYYNERRVGMPYRTQLISQNGGVLNEDLISMKIYGDTVYSVGDRGFYCSINLRNGYEEPSVISSGYIAKYENRFHYLHSIDFKTTNNMYIVGDNIILNSVDGGQTWQKQYIGDGTDTSLVPFKLRSIFVADSCVYAVGVGNVILRGRILPPVTDTTATQPEEKLSSIIDNQATALFYPNPADKFIEFKNLQKNSIVKVIDILGREVFHGKVIGNRLTVENYENGIYSLIISHGKEVRTVKFMVQH